MKTVSSERFSGVKIPGLIEAGIHHHEVFDLIPKFSGVKIPGLIEARIVARSTGKPCLFSGVKIPGLIEACAAATA